MPTLNINGQRVKVGDEFLKLTPEQQDATVDEIAMSLGQSPQMKAGLDELSRMSTDRATMERNVDISNKAGDLQDILGDRRIATEAGLPGSDELGSVLRGVGEMLPGGQGFGEGYSRQMEAEKLARARAAANLGGTYDALSIGAGLGALGAGGTGAGILRSAGEGLAVGAATGGLEGQGQERVGNAALGGGIGAAGGALASLVGNLAQRLGRQPTQNEVAEAAARLGINVPKAVATDSTMLRMGSQGAAGTIAGAPIRNAVQEGQEALGSKVDDIANMISPSDRVAAGVGAKQGLEDYIQKVVPKAKGAAYDRVDNLVDPNVRVPLSATRQSAAKIGSQRAESMLGDSAAVGRVQPALDADGLTYKGVKGLRTSIGEDIKSGRLPADISEGELKSLYGGLSDDLGAAARASSPEAEKAWRVANRYNRILSGRAEALDKLLGNKSDEQIFDTLVGLASTGGRENGRLLSLARMALPKDAWDGMAAGVTRRLGQAPDGTFSPDRFVTAYGKLSEQGKAALFADPKLRGALNDLNTVANAFKRSQKLANHSNTGNVASASAFVGGLLTAPITTLSAAAGVNVFSRLMAKPAAVRQVTAWTKAYNNFAKGGTRAAAMVLQNQTKTLGATIARELGQPQLAPYFTDQLLSAKVGPTGDKPNQEMGMGQARAATL